MKYMRLYEIDLKEAICRAPFCGHKTMPFDIQKGDQIFGPHTRDELESFVARGEVDGTDIVIEESGERTQVHVFMSRAKPLKLKLAAPIAPPVPAASVAPKAESVPPPISATPKPFSVPPPMPVKAFPSAPPAAPVPLYRKGALPAAKRLEKPFTGSLYHKAASYSYVALCLSIPLSFVLLFVRFIPDPAHARLLVLAIGVVFFSAIPAGIIALLGIGSYGKEGLLWKGLCGAIIPSLVLWTTGPNVLSKLPKGPSVETIISIMVNEVNKAGPRMVDEHTRLEGATIGPGKRRIVMKLTTVSMRVSEIDRAIWNREVAPSIRRSMANSKYAFLFREGLVLVYRYSDREGLFVDEIVVDANSIKEPT